LKFSKMPKLPKDLNNLVESFLAVIFVRTSAPGIASH